jgi:hypothetical protein
MTELQLPPSQKERSQVMTVGRQVTIIGANGAGKSRFMDEMMHLCGERAYCLNALSAFFPEREESTMPGSIDDLYRRAVRQQSYMRTDAVSQLDKLSYMLFADEMESLLELKESALEQGEKLQLKPTKTDKIKEVWERIFPGNNIIRERGRLMFTTYGGDDYVYSTKLSQGEQTVLYYLGGVLYAPKDAVIFIDSPQLFIHPSIITTVWNSIEEMRPDCTFVYNTVDVDFITSRTSHRCIWVKSFSSEKRAWDYELLDRTPDTERMLLRLAGSRQPILFIEGDEEHSIDIRLYSAVFHNFTVRPLGSCDKVIETTRSFNDSFNLHHLQSMGIVDRDRRTEQEVAYLRRKNILVPEVAEVENIFLLPEIVEVMARRQGKDGEKILRRLQREVIRMFKRDAEEQALQHVRYRVKREVECKIDARFKCITALEMHLQTLPNRLQPRKQYNRLREEFAQLVVKGDYKGILKVFNHKPMLPDSELHLMLGYHSKEEYISAVIKAMRGNGKDARRLRSVVRTCLKWEELKIDNNN